MNDVVVPIMRLATATDLPLPEYATPLSSGVDLVAAIVSPVKIMPGCRVTIPTGIGIGLPPGYEAQVRPRSGLADQYGLTVLNAPGTIDADYRGEIKVLLYNTGEDMVLIKRGMRIAQLVVCPVVRVVWNDIAQLSTTTRGDGGFGSTGV